jgi:dipeptidyl aminopeptidase/acylaminoacyl peptidase
MSAPFPSDLAASPRGDAISFVLNKEGVRNIWIAQSPAFRPSKITSFTVDDGQALSDLSWLPDDSAVLFTRGGGPNDKGEFPNPSGNADGGRQEVWIAPLGGAPRRVGDGRAAAASPDGRTAIWLRGGQIWSADLPAAKTVVQLTRARGSASGLSWSPDSTRVAFASNRGDHSFIGVYDVRSQTISFPDPATDFDQAAAWSPDGNELAFIRIAGSRNAPFTWGPHRTAQPWSIRVASAKTGKGRELWRAREGMGSVFWPMTAVNQLLWSSEGRIVFPWEGDGWLHLYSVPAAQQNAEATLLTRGNFEIEHAALALDGKSVVYSSNQEDTERRHLWRVPVGGGVPQALTKGQGIEARPVRLSENRVAFVASGAVLPARVALLDSGTTRDLFPVNASPDFSLLDPKSSPFSALTVPEQVEFQSSDGIRVHAQLFRPLENPGAARRPAVIFFHGGPRRQMLLGWHYSEYYSRTYAFNQYLVSIGFVVLAVNYRSGTGYGETFREALNFGPTGGTEFADVLAAGKYLQGRQDVDGKRIGLWGGSYGGYLTALGLARASDMFAAGFDLSGVHDYNLEPEAEPGIRSFPPYDPQKRVDLATTAFHSSAMAYMDTWRSPVLLIHGDDDRDVPFTETVLLAEQLRAHKISYEELVFPDEVHEFLVHRHWLEAYSAAAEFLVKYLKP